VWAGAVLVSTLVLLALGWWYSTHAFRQTLLEVLQTRDVDLVSQTELAKEIGLLLGVRPQPSETTEAFAQRIQRALGLRARGAPPAPRHEELEEFDNPLS
jgi:hypothetical protein